MRNSLLRPAVAIAMGLVLLLAGGAARGTAGAQTDVAAINKIWEFYTEGVNRGDVDLWISLWDEKGIQMPPDAPAVVGKAEIRSRVATRWPQLNIQIAITNEETWVSGNFAFSRGTFTRSVTPKAGGNTALFDGKYLTVMRKIGRRLLEDFSRQLQLERAPQMIIEHRV